MYFRCVPYILLIICAGHSSVTDAVVTPPEKPRNSFFALCFDAQDSQRRDLTQQAAMLKELGYDGAGHVGLDGLSERLKTLDDNGLRLFQVYLQIDVAAAQPFDLRLKDALPLLAKHKTMLALLMRGGKPSDVAGDVRAVEIIHRIAELAQPHGVRVTLYPHAGNWLERMEDALRVTLKVDRRNVGVMFNLCHWLKVDDDKNLRPLLESAMPHLLAVSINGADAAAGRDAGWDRLIQPLDRGTFDPAELMQTLMKLGYNGPIGLQCYGIHGDSHEHLKRSMAAWRRLAATVPYN